MRLAKFPGCSPWFRSSLLSDITYDELERMEPVDATVLGIAEKNRSYYRATIQRPTGPAGIATGYTAAEAVRNAARQIAEQAA